MAIPMMNVFKRIDEFSIDNLIIVKFCIVVYFLITVLYFVSEDFYQLLHQFILNQHRIEGGVDRGTGIANLSPEPGLSALSISFMTFYILKTTKYKLNIQNTLFFIMAIFCILCTKSGAGYLSLLIIFIYLLSRLKINIIILPLFILFYLISINFLLSLDFSNNHGVKQIISLVTFNFESGSSLTVRFLDVIDLFRDYDNLGVVGRIFTGSNSIVTLDPGYAVSSVRLIYGFGIFGILLIVLYFSSFKNTIFLEKFWLAICMLVICPITFGTFLFIKDKR